MMLRFSLLCRRVRWQLVLVCCFFPAITVVLLHHLLKEPSVHHYQTDVGYRSLKAAYSTSLYKDVLSSIGIPRERSCERVSLVVVVGGHAAVWEFVRLIKSVLHHRIAPLDVHLIVDEAASHSLLTTFESWSLPAVSIFLHNVSDFSETVSWIPNKHYSGIYGLLKLVIPDLLPVSVETAVVVDTDTVFLSDIGQLLTWMQGRNCSIAMVENQSDWYKREDAWPAVGLGFNSGVMVLNLERLRQTDWKETWIRRTKELLPSKLLVHLADQDVFNAVSTRMPGLFCNLPCTFNMQFSDSAVRSRCADVASATVIHWNTPDIESSLDLSPDVRLAAERFKEFEQMDGYLLRSALPSTCASVRADVNFLRKTATEGISRLRLPMDDVGCDEFLEQLRFKYRVSPHVLGHDSSIDAPLHLVTMVLQLSPDRVYMLEIIASNYIGPISISVYISDFEAPHFLDFVKSSDTLASRLDIVYHFVFKHGSLYPVNKLRNVAIAAVLTPYVFLLDVDFVPSPQLSTIVGEFITSFNEDYGSQTAFVIPAFELTSVTWSSEAPLLPSSKQELLAMVENGTIVQFNARKWPQGHAATDYVKWYQTNIPYEVEWQKDYEPYLVVSMEGLPPFDEAFSGFGWNKVAHAMSLAQSGYKFVVLPDVWVVHIPHPPSPDIRRYQRSPTYRKCMKWFKADFVKRLLKRTRLLD